MLHSIFFRWLYGVENLILAHFGKLLAIKSIEWVNLKYFRLWRNEKLRNDLNSLSVGPSEYFYDEKCLPHSVFELQKGIISI